VIWKQEVQSSKRRTVEKERVSKKKQSSEAAYSRESVPSSKRKTQADSGHQRKEVD
jgi:hypothetical protein